MLHGVVALMVVIVAVIAVAVVVVVVVGSASWDCCSDGCSIISYSCSSCSGSSGRLCCMRLL